MIRVNSLARHLAGRPAVLLKEHQSPAKALQAFDDEVAQLYGLKHVDDVTGELTECRDEMGHPVLAEKRANASAVGIGELAEALGVRELFDPQATGAVGLREASFGVGIDPTTFVNISAWNTAVSRILQARIMESYVNPAYIGKTLVQTMQSNQDRERMIGVGAIPKGYGAQKRLPNQPHPRANLGERWQDTPTTDEYALALDVTKEAVFFDRTGDVLRMAEQVGDSLGFEQDLMIARVIYGLVNNYSYKGTGYNTYLTSGAWINDHSNPVSDEKVLDRAKELFIGMTDPETQRRVRVDSSRMKLVIAEERHRAWDRVFNATEVRSSADSAVTTVLAPASAEARSGMERVSNPEWTQLLVDEGGLTLAQAREWWVQADFAKAFAWIENWPLMVTSVTPEQYHMIDRGIARSFFANHRGVAASLEPRYTVRNKN